MATIRPDDLPGASSVTNTDVLIVDKGSAVQKATPSQVVDAAIPLASQTEAEAGTDNAKRVTPLRVSQAIGALGVSAVNLASSDVDKGAALIGVSANETAADVFDQQVRITTFGAKFDVGADPDIANATDDTAAWVAALAYLDTIGGGTLLLPPGASKVTAQLEWPNVPIRVAGTGRRKVYPGVYTAGTATPSLLVPVHTDNAAIRFRATAAGQGMSSFENFNLATLETGDVPTAAFAWDTGGGFLYGYTFRQCGIHGFTDAFQVYNSAGAELACGVVLVEDCVVNRNQNCWRHLNSTYINDLTVRNNKSGQNTVAGWNATGPNLSFLDNILESTPNPIAMNGQYRSHIAKGNYFEANTGTYCIYANGSVSVDIGPNNYQSVTTTHKALMSFVESGSCTDPYWSSGVHKVAPPQIGNTAAKKLDTTATTPFLRVDRFEGANFARPPRYSAIRQSLITANQVREINPQTGNPMIMYEHTTSGDGSLVAVNGSLAGAIGDWVIACWVFRRIPDGGAAVEPYIRLFANTTLNQTDHAIFRYTRCWQEGDFTLVTAAMKLTVTMTSARVVLYPYGISPAAGRVSHTNLPDVYVVDDINKAVPFLDNKNIESTAAAPTGGTWVTGDVLRSTAGGFYKCTAGGTPGTWSSI